MAAFLVLLASGILCYGLDHVAVSAGAKQNKKPLKTENFHAPDVRIAPASLAGGDLVLELTMVNRGPGDFRVLRWNFPGGEEMTSRLFAITRNGQEVAYRGKMVKRRVTADSYRTLEPGKEYSVRINLAPAYDVSAPGHYKIQYEVINQSAPDADKLVLTDLRSNQLEVER